MPPPTTLEEALTIIDIFKAEQAALVKHISKTDTNFLNAPPNVKALMQHGEEGVSVLAGAIRKNLQAACFGHNDDVELEDFGSSTMKSDDLSNAVFHSIAVIKDLVDGENGDELTKVRAGYDLLFRLKSCSVGDFDEDCGGYGDCPSDEPADNLLSSGIQRRKDAGDVWDWGKDLENLKWEVKDNAGYGVEPWFPKSIDALSALVTGAGEAA